MSEDPIVGDAAAAAISGGEVELSAENFSLGGNITATRSLKLTESQFYVHQLLGRLKAPEITFEAKGKLGLEKEPINIETEKLTVKNGNGAADFAFLHNSGQALLTLDTIRVEHTFELVAENAVSTTKAVTGGSIAITTLQGNISIGNGMVGEEFIKLLAGHDQVMPNGSIVWAADNASLSTKDLILGARDGIGQKDIPIRIAASGNIEIGSQEGLNPRNAYIYSLTRARLSSATVKDEFQMKSQKSIVGVSGDKGGSPVTAANLHLETARGGIGESEHNPLYVRTQHLTIDANTVNPEKTDGVFVYDLSERGEPMSVSGTNHKGHLFIRSTSGLQLGSLTATDGYIWVVSDHGALAVNDGATIHSQGWSVTLQALEGRAEGARITIGEGAQIISDEGLPLLNKVAIVVGALTGLVLPLPVAALDGGPPLPNTVVEGSPTLFFKRDSNRGYYVTIGINSQGGLDTTQGPVNRIVANNAQVIISAPATSGAPGAPAIVLKGGVLLRAGSELTGPVLLLPGNGLPRALPVPPQRLPQLPSPVDPPPQLLPPASSLIPPAGLSGSSTTETGGQTTVEKETVFLPVSWEYPADVSTRQSQLQRTSAAGTAAVIQGHSRIPLHVGSELVVREGADVDDKVKFGRRKIGNIDGGSGLRIQYGELSLPAAAAESPVLSHLLSQRQARERKLARSVLKTFAAWSIVSAGHGGYFRRDRGP